MSREPKHNCAERDWQTMGSKLRVSFARPNPLPIKTRSVGITVRMRDVPGPRGGNDVLELWELRFPAEFAHGFVGGGHEFGRVAGAARFLHGGDGFTGNFFARLDHLPHRVAVSIAKVEEAAFARREAEDVRLREVHDVDVVADARAVGRRV